MFVVKVPGGTQVSLTDLPLEQLERIEEETGTRWPVVLGSPAASMKVARITYQVVCEFAGAEPETLSARQVLEGDVFENVDDDLPVVFEDGVPKVEAVPPTSGSSTGPSASGGRPRSPKRKA